jgi:hypothetical protein
MKKLCIIVSLFLFSTIARSETMLPTDIELRASYCSAVLKYYIEMYSYELTKEQPYDDIKKSLQKLENNAISNRERIAAYLIPRIYHIDPLPMEFAKKRGEIDAGKIDNESQLRKSYCDKIDWLPF